MPKPKLYPKLQKYCESLVTEFDLIEDARKTALIELATYIKTKISAQKIAQITVICTHNSRRSHLGQIWLQTAATFYEIKNIQTFSGGTEATAFNPRAVAALERVGFVIEKEGNDTNPNYQVSFGQNSPKQKMFSKKYADPANPQAEFCALLVCSQADEACPLVRGADKRIAHPYEDPKAFDGKPEESAKYDERCRQIAREMFFVLNYVSKKL